MTIPDGAARDRLWQLTRGIRLDTDEDDAKALGQVFNKVTELLRGLREDGASEKIVELAEKRIETRAGREILELHWELPRRPRGSNPKLLSSKFGYGAAWTPAALELLFNGQDTPDLSKNAPWVGKIQFEHVVPASQIVEIASTVAWAWSHEPQRLADALHELCVGVVSVQHTKDTPTKQPDQPKTRLLPEDEATDLYLHYLGYWSDHVLDTQALFETKWARYLRPELSGTISWRLDELSTVDEEIARRSAK